MKDTGKELSSSLNSLMGELLATALTKNVKRKIEISASMTGTISTGQWENEKPLFSVRETLEGDGLIGMTDEMIRQRQAELYGFCEDAFKSRAKAAYADKVAQTYRTLRFYDVDGTKFPSVTSVVGWDADFHIPPDQLAQYAARGTIIHKQVEIFLRSGEWKDPKDIPEVYPELVTVTKGDLGLEVDDVDFRGFYKDFPIKVAELETTLINRDHQYAGRADIIGWVDPENPGKWGKVEGFEIGVPTIFDVKTGSVDKVRCMKQLTAYAKAAEVVTNLPGQIGQICVIHLNKETKQGYSKPIVENNLDKYWTLFLKDREEFRNRYGL